MLRRTALILVALVLPIREGATDDPAWLATPVTASWSQDELPRVIEQLRTAGVPCRLDDRTPDAWVDRRVTLRVRTVPAGVVLDLVARDLDLVVRRSATEAVFGVRWDPRLPVERREYDLRRFLAPGGSAGVEGGDDLRNDWANVEEHVEILIKEQIAKGSWDTTPYSVTVANGSLLARHQPEVLAEVDRVLAYLDALYPRPSTLEWAVAEAPVAEVPAAFRILGRSEAERMLAAAPALATAWGGRRRLSLTALGQAEQGAEREVRVADTPLPGSTRTRLEAEAWRYRRADAERVRAQIVLDLALAGAGEAPDEHRVGALLDLGDGDLAILPLTRLGDRARVLLIGAALPAGPPWPAEPTEAPEPGALAELRRRLETPLNLDLEEKSLAETVEILHDMGEIWESSVHACAAVRDRNAPEPGTRFHCDALPVREVLDRIAARYGVSWSIRPGLVVFDRGPAWEPVAPIRAFDVRDLQMGRGGFAVPALRRFGPDSESAQRGALLALELAERAPEPMDGRADSSIPLLQDYVQPNLAPQSWEERAEEVNLVQLCGGLWVVHAQSVLRETRALLDGLRAQQPRPIVLDCTWRESTAGAPGETISLPTTTQGLAYAAAVRREGKAGAPQDGFRIVVETGSTSDPERLRVRAIIERVRAEGREEATFDRVFHDGVLELSRGRESELRFDEAGRALLLQWDWAR